MIALRKVLTAAVALLLLSFPFTVFGQTVVMNPAGHDISKPLREMQVVLPQFENFNDHPVKPLPAMPAGGPDGALQTKPIVTSATISGITSFEGPGVSSGLTISGEPPDTNGSVGSTQYVSWVNTSFAVYDKATNAKVFPATGFAAGNTIWSGFSGGRCATDNSGDPIVLFDKQAQRWIFTQFAVSTTPYFQCVAVSQTADATGAYNRYAYSFSTNFPDYPKVGIWTDGYYFTFNIFAHGRTFAGAQICAMDRTTALAGGAAKLICNQLSKSFGGVLPADLDGASGATGTTALPPAGTAEYFVNFGTNSLNVWRMTPNFTAGTVSVTGPTNLPVATFSRACNGGACIPQLGTTQQLDSLADRLMFRLSYRNFGTFASLLTNHSVTAGTGTGIRWYELRDTGAGPSVFQQGTFAPDSSFRWMGSMAQDKQGNIAVGYSVSSSAINPAIRFASRAAADAAGQLSQETSTKVGTGSQSGHTRWGDYASVSVDPTDDCTFWFTTEYISTSGDFIWSTQVSHFKLGTCQ